MSINIAIGFVTGRKHFPRFLSTYINNWLEHGLVINKNIRLHILVAYDLKYAKTNPEDYKNINPELTGMIDSISFYGKAAIEAEKERITADGKLTREEANYLFGDGYAKRRNTILYFAIKRKMDRLIFLDDDEYPLAVMKNNFDNLIWMGQSVVGSHIKYSSDVDITHGHHCGYISPIPAIPFNNTITEPDFKLFIQAISNEIISWKSIKKILLNQHGITYADPEIINKNISSEVTEQNGMKFISGANLCFNLQNCRNKLPPFYNPPEARGEDTFMSTALTHLKVKKIPAYTFHDGFLQYQAILRGILPTDLQPVNAASPEIVKRFIAATIGWVRYKPLMLYITRHDDYFHLIRKMQIDLEFVVPKFCRYFNTDRFQQVIKELAFYHKNVRKHFESLTLTQQAWKKLIGSL